jgi:ribulose-phosphate 3-epimerase
MNIEIAPSILSADLGNLAEQIVLVAEGGADMIHVDVMDGRFVPSLTFGQGVIAAARRATELPLDVHLMVEEPENYIEAFAEAGATIFTFHPETTRHVHRQLAAIREAGMQAGLALNPATPLGWAEEVIDDLDLLLVMSVNPGYAGQHYLPATNRRIARARSLLDSCGRQVRLEVDGGVSRETIRMAHASGASTFVAGSAIFGADDPVAEMHELRRRCAVTV